ncbi:MAG TPA: DUF1801 domain-containing protein [Planctomycetota bacterium]|nr:DUF1801 domain-containing protein [Planctomycetota bacterium]
MKRPAKPTRQRAVKPKADASEAGSSVDAYMRELEHPLKREIELLRKLILGVSPKIREEVKWRAPSFRTSDFFATIHNPLRSMDSVMMILHRGARAKGLTIQGKIEDPDGLLKWLAKDRAIVTFANAKAIQGKRAALQAVIGEWIRLV